MYYIGLDLSLSSTGVAAIDAEGFIVETAAIKTKPAKGVVNRIQRFGFISRAIVAFVTAYSPCKILIEGYSHGSVGFGLIDRAELGGIIRHQIVFGCPDVESIEELAPQSLKKRITGVGRGGGKEGKAMMKKAIDEIFGPIDLTTNDEYDAVGLALCCGEWR